MPETSYTAAQSQALWKPKTRWFPILIIDVFLVLGALAFLSESSLFVFYSSVLLTFYFMIVIAASAATLQGRPALEGIGPAVETAMRLV